MAHPDYEGEFKAQTLAYIYALQRDEAFDGLGPETIEWHWHPRTTSDRPEPHVHVRIGDVGLGKALGKLHIPSGRVSFEAVIGFLINDLDVEPTRKDWREIVGESEERFRTFRSWA